MPVNLDLGPRPPRMSGFDNQGVEVVVVALLVVVVVVQMIFWHLLDRSDLARMQVEMPKSKSLRNEHLKD